MRKRIERSLDETLEFFFDELGWGISGAEKTLIKSEDYIDEYSWDKVSMRIKKIIEMNESE
jgi:hypothetical protein